MKETIRINLQNLFNRQFEKIRDKSFHDFIDIVMKDNPEALNLDNNSVGLLYDDLELLKLEKLKTNQILAELYNSLISKLKPEFNVSDSFKLDILNSIEKIKKKVKGNSNRFENQIIFLVYDYDPVACFCGFGPGDYPILEVPKYFDFNSREEVYNGIGEINYTKLWKEKIDFDELLTELDEEIDLGDLIFNTDIYDCLRSAYKTKTDLMLFEAFDKISLDSFSGIPIKLPLFIFSNEHDCKPMNVYIYE